jgi:hypothetical protein
MPMACEGIGWRIAMKGFMRQRGDAWELRVYVGRDAVTENSAMRAERCAAASVRLNVCSPRW